MRKLRVRGTRFIRIMDRKLTPDHALLCGLRV